MVRPPQKLLDCHVGITDDRKLKCKKTVVSDVMMLVSSIMMDQFVRMLVSKEGHA